MRRIPFFDLSRQHMALKKEIAAAIASVVKKSAFSGGAFVSKFEEEFARYCGVSHVSALNSGSAAIHLALLALGVKKGDEVIVPAHTFIASAWGISYIGATPVFVDCLPDTWEVDPAAVEKAITKKTRAIIAVHLYGVPCDIKALKRIAKKRRLFLIEDCAQAHGALVGGKMVGSFGDAAAFSFYPSKNLGALGEAGAIATHDPRVAERVRMLRSHGEKKKYVHELIGYNERMDGIQAAVLSSKLRRLAHSNKRKAAIVKKYRDGIVNPLITLQRIPSGIVPAYHLFVVLVHDRARFIEHMSARKIDTALHYPTPCHLQKAYSALGYKKGDLPRSEYVAAHCASLPLFPELTAREVERVIDAVNAYVG